MNVVCNFVLNHQAVFATGTWAFRAHFWKFLPPRRKGARRRRVIGYKLKVIGAENEEATSLRQGPLSPKVRLKKKLNREWGKSYWL
jgi:hypothetical protein